jgi:hypothetical protein
MRWCFASASQPLPGGENIQSSWSGTPRVTVSVMLIVVVDGLIVTTPSLPKHCPDSLKNGKENYWYYLLKTAYGMVYSLSSPFHSMQSYYENHTKRGDQFQFIQGAIHHFQTGAAIWSKTNFGPTGHYHPQSSPILCVCTVPSISAIF